MEWQIHVIELSDIKVERHPSSFNQVNMDWSVEIAYVLGKNFEHGLCIIGKRPKESFLFKIVDILERC